MQHGCNLSIFDCHIVTRPTDDQPMHKISAMKLVAQGKLRYSADLILIALCLTLERIEEKGYA